MSTVKSSNKTPVWSPEASDRRRPAPVYGVRVLESPDKGVRDRCYPIVAPSCIGRIEEGPVNLCFDDRLLSRQHATLTPDEADATRVLFADQRSTNGSFVEGVRTIEAVLEPDTVLRVGQTVLWYGELPRSGAQRQSRLVGESNEMQRLHQEIEQVSPTSLSVMVLGETGTGKELVARRLHELSGRSGAFVAVNCGAVPEALAEAFFFGHRRGAFTGAVQDSDGCFVAADGGTLFLDEVGELPLVLQAKILRALDDFELTPVGATKPVKVDVRVICATNVDLKARLATDAFRRDLFARLAGFTLRTPALRERRSDILLLLRHFMGERAPELGVQALEALLMHDWPMNLRELAALAQRLTLHGKDVVVDVQDLPEELRATQAKMGTAARGAPPREELEGLLKHFDGNVALVAAHYARARFQIYRWLRKHGLDAESYRSGGAEGAPSPERNPKGSA